MGRFHAMQPSIGLTDKHITDASLSVKEAHPGDTGWCVSKWAKRLAALLTAAKLW